MNRQTKWNPGPISLSKMQWLLSRKIHETRGLNIRLSSSSTRSPGILSKILVLNLCFKVANYAKSWFHGHSCTVLPITTAHQTATVSPRKKMPRFISVGINVSRHSAGPYGLITPSHQQHAVQKFVSCFSHRRCTKFWSFPSHSHNNLPEALAFCMEPVGQEEMHTAYFVAVIKLSTANQMSVSPLWFSFMTNSCNKSSSRYSQLLCKVPAF